MDVSLSSVDSSTVALPSPSPTNKLESGERDPLQSPAIDEGECNFRTSLQTFHIQSNFWL